MSHAICSCTQNWFKSYLVNIKFTIVEIFIIFYVRKCVCIDVFVCDCGERKYT